MKTIPNECCICGIMFLMTDNVVFMGSANPLKTSEGLLELPSSLEGVDLTIYHSHCWSEMLHGD